MQQLQMVLTRRGRELVALLVHHRTFDVPTAERFVAVAGHDLVRSYEWQHRELELDERYRPRTVRALLHGIHARRIADLLDVPTEQVWRGLRTFVPTVVQMAGAISRDTLEADGELAGAGALH